MCISDLFCSYAPLLVHFKESPVGFASDTLLAGSVGVVKKEREEFIIHWLLMRRDAQTADIEAIRFPHSTAVKSQRLGFLFLTLSQLKFGPRAQLDFF